jgi:hypothetical protein
MKMLLTRQEAADYLGIDYGQFLVYDLKAKLCYHLIGRTRMYRIDEVARFKREVIDKL